MLKFLGINTDLIDSLIEIDKGKNKKWEKSPWRPWKCFEAMRVAEPYKKITHKRNLLKSPNINRD